MEFSLQKKLILLIYKFFVISVLSSSGGYKLQKKKSGIQQILTRQNSPWLRKNDLKIMLYSGEKVSQNRC